MKKKHKIWIGASLLCLITGLFSFTNSGTNYFEIAKNLDIFATMYKEVNKYYVEDVNPNHFMKTGIDAMLASLDPYTNYIPEDQIEDFRTMTTGEYGGIGAIIGKRNNQNTVLMSYKGFPAEKSGLIIGDVILKIDDIDIKNKSTEAVSRLLKGQAKTSLKLTIKRYGVKEPFEIDLQRERISVDNVPYYGMVDENIGYIKLSDFTTGAGREVEKALLNLKAQGAQKLVLDLRDNPGGLLGEAVNVSNIFIPKGSEVVSTRGRIEEWNKTYVALNNPIDTEIPIVVLTNGRSASAAEIVAGVIQDYDRGVLVGQKTFGKGLVQATRPLTYNSQLKITTAKYYTPSGRCIQAIDYRHKGDDDTEEIIVDSLKAEFTTVNGRVVYDGAGIDPDIFVKAPTYSPIAISLAGKGLLFDYATQYRHLNPEIAPARSFRLSDEEYEAFVTWLSDKDYDYTTKVEKTIEDLIANSKTEKYYDDIKGQIEDLREKVQHNKEHDLRKFKDEISSMLEQEIVSRYYLQEGIVEVSFKHDAEVLKAKEVLNNNELYGSTLEKM